MYVREIKTSHKRTNMHDIIKLTPFHIDHHEAMAFHVINHHLSCFKAFTCLVLVFFSFHTNNYVALADDRITYIVHMNKSDMPKVFLSHEQWYSLIHYSIKHPNSSDFPTLLYTYDNALHGFATSLSPYELDTLTKL